MSERATASPLRGRYLVRNRGWNAALSLTDAVLGALVRPRAVEPQGAPRRILLGVGGHLGDAVIATSVLPLLEHAYPDAAVGMLLPSWSRPVVEGHPRLHWLHHADHWKMNRATAGVDARWRRYRSSATRVIRELKTVGYDVAIDLYAYYPNAAWLLWRAGIPIRVGYRSGGCGPLYTIAIDWSASTGHTAAQHRRLITELGKRESGPAEYDLPPISADAIERATRIVHAPYVVIHPGTGDPRKQWPVERWAGLVQRLRDTGERIVITGQGENDRRIASAIRIKFPDVIDVVDDLDWPIFRAVVANASMLIGVDSVATHVAAAAGIPTVAIMAAMSDPQFWRPLGENVVVLTRELPCAPCFRKNGCAAMSCVRDVSLDDVLAAYRRLRDASRVTQAEVVQ